MSDRAQYEKTIGELSESKLLEALLKLGADESLDHYSRVLRADLCKEAETRYPATEDLMRLWLDDPNRDGSYAHALVAAVLVTKEFGL